jgi:hypothetical protein
MTPWPPRASDPSQRSAIPSGLTLTIFAFLNSTGCWSCSPAQVDLLDQHLHGAGNGRPHQVVLLYAGVVT